MQALRALISHRAVTALLLACALMMRIVVPSGFMPSAGAVAGSNPHFTMQICDGAGAAATTIALPERGGAHKTPAGQGASPCPFAVLALAMLGGVTPPLDFAPPSASSPPPRPLARADSAAAAPTGLPPSHAPPAKA